jgi:hypothetical protein
MTPEERFTKIENLLQSLTEHQVHAEARQADIEARVSRIEDGFTEMQGAITDLSGDVRLLASASGDLVNVSRDLVESNGVMRDLLVLQSKRLDRLEGQA